MPTGGQGFDGRPEEDAGREASPDQQGARQPAEGVDEDDMDEVEDGEDGEGEDEEGDEVTATYPWYVR